MTERVPIGMIGIRGWGNVLREGIVQAGNLELVVAATRSPESVQRLRQQWPKVDIVPTLDDLLARDDIVGFVSNMPNHFHLEHILKAAEAVKHIFVEKPITNTVAEAKQAIDAVERSGIICQVGHNHRTHPAVRRMRQLIAEGALGRVFAVEGNFSHRGGLAPPTASRSWRRQPETCPAVPLMQLGVHLIDTVNYLLDLAPLRVAAVHRNIAMEHSATDLTSQIIEYPNNILFSLTSYYIAPRTAYLHVFGTEGALYSVGLEGGAVELRLRGVSGEDKVERYDWDGAPTTAEMREFGQCLATGTQPEVTPRVAIKALAPVEAAIISSREGRTVELDEILP